MKSFWVYPILLLVGVLLSSTPVDAMLPQNPTAQRASDHPVLDFAGQAASSRMDIDYAFIWYDKTTVKGIGNVQLQNRSFVLKSSGTEIFSDGESRWLVDETGREVYIESVDLEHYSILSNPVLCLSQIGEYFKIGPMQKGHFQQKNSEFAVLTPADPSEVLQIEFHFHARQPLGLKVTMADGKLAEIALNKVVFRPLGNDADFRFDTSSLDDSWLVNDLR